MQHQCMHLRNYAVNKHSIKYVHDDGALLTAGDRGCKRCIWWFLLWVWVKKG